MVVEYLNLYDLFVNMVFGSVLLGVVGFIALLWVVSFIMRISTQMMTSITLFFLFTFFSVYNVLYGMLIWVILMVEANYGWKNMFRRDDTI